MEYSKYLASLIKFSKAPKLIYSQNKWLKAISHMKEAEEKNAELVKELEAVKAEQLSGYIENMRDLENSANLKGEAGLRMMCSFAAKTATEYAKSLINNKEG